MIQIFHGRKHVHLCVLVVCLLLLSCGQDYRSLSTPNGKQAILEEASNYLTSGNCAEALDTLKPLYNSPYVDADVRMMYASGYACKAGFSFPSLVSGLTSASGDIWSALVKANPSKTSSDDKTANLLIASRIVRETSTISDQKLGNYFDAYYRTSDANAYMLLLQLSIISTTISRTSLGNADSTTGNQKQLLTGLGTNAELCAVSSALVTVQDCLNNLSTGSGSVFTSISNTLNTICGGTCSGSKDPSVCSATQVTAGAAYFISIDSLWTGP